MAHTDRTIALDSSWDIGLDGNGGIALRHGARATEQNVANSCRLFTNDDYFEKTRGIPHFNVDISQRLSQTIVKTALRREAQKVFNVAEVVEVELEPLDLETRVLKGAIIFRRENEDNEYKSYI